ncbi:hypothetical protein ABIF25_005081 [Bradyrhizobium elkanii]
MSNRLRNSVSVGSTTLKPRLRIGSTRPPRLSSSSASRTGVEETPRLAARDGTEYIVPGRLCPEMISARTRCSTCSRKFWSMGGRRRLSLGTSIRP